MHFTIRIGELRVMVLFFMVQNLAVVCLLETGYKNHSAEAVLPGLWRAVVYHCFLPSPLANAYLLSQKILHPSNRRPIPRRLGNEKSHYSANVLKKHANTCKVTLCLFRAPRDLRSAVFLLW